MSHAASTPDHAGSITVNLAFLALDIYIAHSVNQFRHAAEYIPLYFSIAVPLALATVILLRWVWHFQEPWRDVGYLVGWLAVLIGLGGVIFHLESRFFVDRTLKSLTYAAPFAAPLAYSGLGFLLLANRMVDSRSAEWAHWIIFLALGGFFGNFVLTLTDHASNGFFQKTEWIPVISSAFATGFLVVPLMLAVTRRYLDVCLVVMLVQALVGILGFWLHLDANLTAPRQKSLRPAGEWRTSHGSAPLPESCCTRVHRSVGFDSPSPRCFSPEIMAWDRLHVGTLRRRNNHRTIDPWLGMGRISWRNRAKLQSNLSL